MSDDLKTEALNLHRQFKGKITLKLRDQLTPDKLRLYYTPGVGEVSRYLTDHPDELAAYTWTNNLVAVISNGSSVLGLGDIGARAGLPVMEGKSLLFKYFADIDSVPIVIDEHDPEKIIATIKAISPSFGAINLEDFAAPDCFLIEDRLKAECDIPVFHDDQHGTAVVVLAGLINACKVTGRDLSQAKIVMVGAGAAGTAIAKLLNLYGVGSIIMCDSKGIIGKSRDDLNAEKTALLEFIDGSKSGTLNDALTGADIFIGVSRPGLLTGEMIKSMNERSIVFALANPTPEIMPDLAKAAGATVVATGRSDFPNQINNALAFPGIFRGALDNKVKAITDEHKIAAAKAIAKLVELPTADQIIPSVFDKRLVPTIAQVVK